MRIRRILPREKLEQIGVAALSDTDLVGVLLCSGVEGRGVLEVSRSVARMISMKMGHDIADGERSGVLTWKDFRSIKGVGKVKAMQIECAVELGKRCCGKGNEGRTVIRGRSDVVKICAHLKGKKQEHVVVLGLNARNEMVGKRTVAIGSLNKAVVEPREILGWALSAGVAGVILVHNHPSGGTDQSESDKVFTERVRRAADLLGIEFIDHVIV
jgi:DNA repair protein RadC